MDTTYVLTMAGTEVEVSFNEDTDQLVGRTNLYTMFVISASDFMASSAARLFDAGTQQTIMMLAGR